MAVRVKVTTNGFDAVQRSLIARIAKLKGAAPRRALESVGKQVISEWKANIRDGGNHSYEFEELAPHYAKWKRKQVGNKPILVFSRSMMNGLGYAVVGLWRASKTRLDLGVSGRDPRGRSNFEKALYHRDGTGRMPARNFMLLAPGMLTRLLREALQRELK